MNRLSREKSPYLLQHAANPVDWYPWGDEAFAAARREDKPIFLSVGYSTCHWCHVMAHESFEDPRVATVLNEHYVSIKVDREERPDVDRIYMAFVQATTGGGGWPMSVWLTPDRRPFFGGTYFPPASRWGKPGFADVLLEMSRLWRTERGRVEQAAAGVVEHIGGAAGAGGLRVPGAIALDGATGDLLGSFDARYGGFGGAPKFPRPSELLFLLREHRRTGDRAPLDAAVLTLRAMAAGGMRDHVGGGFHRYSVDGQWRVPHFEKMLYDQAQLVLAYLEGAQATGDATLAHVAEDTLGYVERVLTDGRGGFFSAEDADSLPPGAPAGGHASEGAFYLWSIDEVERVLGPDARLFCERYGVLPGGNALNDPLGEFAGRNILYEAQSVDQVAAGAGKPTGQVDAALRRSLLALRTARDARPRPQLDDKVLTAWNGLAIAAFARASRVVPAFAAGSDEAASSRPRYLMLARRAARFVREQMWDPATGRLRRRYRAGDVAVEAYAEDYACLVFGLLELFQADGDAEWLDWAVALQRTLDSLFWDEERGGWFATSGEDETVLLRLKDEYDGAEPAASSVAVLNMLALSHLGVLPDDTHERVERTLALFGPRLAQAPRAVPMMLCALSAWHAGMSEVVVAGPPDDRGTRELLTALERSFEPFAVVVRADAEGEGARRLAETVPWAASLKMRDGKATAYVCRNFACETPATTAGDLLSRLRS